MTEHNPYSAPNAAPELGEESYQPKIFSFGGRIGRLRYLTYSMIYNVVLYFVVGIATAVFLPMLSEGNMVLGIALVLFYIAALAMFVVLASRRLHDLDKSAWLLLLFIVPLANFILALYMIFASGTEGSNKFGLAPVKNHPALWLGLLGPFVFMGILAAVAVPAYQDYVERAKAAQMP